ncbi:MAG TPA: fluoride efflux transporter CrcB [Planctomycetota bacterium]|nr:fluoride efflux transporter CrcB [Planctomycetota bacterium]
MREVLLVGIGGFFGSIARYGAGWLTRALLGPRATAGLPFPWATLAVNLAGCFAIGWILGRSEIQGALSPGVRALLVVGFLGGFTTFSSFGYETFALFRAGHAVVALLYAAGSVVVGLGAVACGFWWGAK